MLRLTRFLKPFSLLILLIVIALFVQANAELALPDYMSKIVNVGIQQNGVENAVPQAVRQSQMDKLLLFMSEEEQTFVLENYILVDPDSPESNAYRKTYPALNEEPIYVLNEIDAQTIEQLNPMLAKAFVTVSSIEQMVADPSKIPPDAQFDISKLPPGVDIFTALGQMPAERLAQLTTQIDEISATLGANMVEQMAIHAVQTEYETLGVDIAELQNDYILRTGGTMLLVSLLAGVATIIAGFLAAKTAAGTARDIRKAVFTKVENFSGAEFGEFSTASLITRSTNDITQVQRVVFMTLRMAFYAPIIGIGGIIRAMDKSPSMWWIIAVVVAALLTLIAIVFSVSLPKFKVIQTLVDRLNLVTREQLSGMMVIRAFNKQDVEEKRFDQANRDLTATSLFVARVMVIMMPMMMLLMNVLSVAIIWVGAHQVAEAQMQVGDMIAFLQYAIQIVFAFLMMSMLFIFLPRAAVSGDRISEVLDTEITINDPPEPKPLPDPVIGRITFNHVSFRYPGAQEDVLHDIHFTAEPGATTAFIGSTGCGKSTLVNLIPRFYDVTEGDIRIDGVDIRDLKQNDLRAQIGYVPQQGTLFSGTIESNLRYADKNADHATLQASIEIAQADEFISARPEGLQSKIGQGGTNISGGQRQRLAIARALVKRPPIFIFDDSFSALDFKTDAALRRALRERTGNSTVLLVTQRVATVKNADQIIVLDEGRIVGKGKHHDLLKTCETYREIAASQLSEEELA